MKLPVLASRMLSRTLLDRANGHRLNVLKKAEEDRSFSFANREDIDRNTNQQLASLLRYACRNVPYFRDVLPDGGDVQPADARDVLRKIDPVTRSVIQENRDAFFGPKNGIVTDDATGGSTGTPLCFKVDREAQIAREASLMWANSLAGWKPGQRIAMLWGSDRDVSHAMQDLRLTVRWFIENRRWYNAFDMGEDKMKDFHRKMQRFRPHIIVAYANAVFEYAHFLRDGGITPSYPGTAIISSAEILPDEARTAIEEIFGKPVFDRYGNREAGAIAAECPAHTGLHINEQDCYLEIQSEDPYTIPGPLLLTYFRNRAMPFIRYDTGDLAMWAAEDPCSCGRTTRRLIKITGRASDMFRTPDGRMIHGEYFTHMLYGSEGIREFQFVQHSLDSYTLRLVADREEVGALLQDWQAMLKKELGADAHIEFDFCDRIPPLPSGKRKFTVSELEP